MVFGVLKLGIQTDKEFQCFGALTQRLFVLKIFEHLTEIHYFYYLLCNASVYLLLT